jgi:hypothetical protein
MNVGHVPWWAQTISLEYVTWGQMIQTFPQNHEVMFILIEWIILITQISIFHSIFNKNGRYSDKNLYGHI